MKVGVRIAFLGQGIHVQIVIGIVVKSRDYILERLSWPKMKIQNYFLQIFLIASIVSCNGNGSDSSIIISGYDEYSDVSHDVVNHVKLIPLEETEGSLLSGPISKIVEVDSAFIVQDFNRGLYRFSRSGKFINKISNKGRSASEFVTLSTFCIDRDGLVLIFDSFTNKVIRFTQNGDFVDIIHVPDKLLNNTQDCVVLGDGKILQTCYLMGDFNKVYSIIDMGTWERTVLYESPMKTDDVMEMVGRHMVSMTGGVPSYVKPFDNSLYTFNGEAKETKCYEIGTESKIPDQKRLASEPFSIMTSVEISNQGFFKGFTGCFETDRHILLTYYNADAFLFSKSDNHGIRFDLENVDDDIVPLLGLVADSDSYLIGVADGSKLSEYPVFNNCLKDGLEFGNPYIILYYLR